MECDMTIEQMLVKAWDDISHDVAVISETKGWDIPVDDVEKLGNKIALMHSELTEALEALRIGNPVSDHLPQFTGMEEEFADVIIRIMHFSYRMGLNIPGAILAKVIYNANRPHKHGGKLF